MGWPQPQHMSGMWALHSPPLQQAQSPNIASPAAPHPLPALPVPCLQVWWGVIEDGQPPKQIIEGGEYFVLKRLPSTSTHH